eukprot:214396-Rhodomonas_salina.1
MGDEGGNKDMRKTGDAASKEASLEAGTWTETGEKGGGTETNEWQTVEKGKGALPKGAPPAPQQCFISVLEVRG